MEIEVVEKFICELHIPIQARVRHMSAIDELKEILSKLHNEHGIEISGLISRNGVPIICNLPSETQVDTFSTLSATMLGAADVIFSGLGKGRPQYVIIDSLDGKLICSGVSQKSALVMLGNKETGEMIKLMDETKAIIQEVFAHEQKY